MKSSQYSLDLKIVFPKTIPKILTECNTVSINIDKFEVKTLTFLLHYPYSAGK